MPEPALESEITIRGAEAGDHDAIWSILEPTIRERGNLHLAARSFARTGA